MNPLSLDTSRDPRNKYVGNSISGHDRVCYEDPGEGGNAKRGREDHVSPRPDAGADLDNNRL